MWCARPGSIVRLDPPVHALTSISGFVATPAYTRGPASGFARRAPAIPQPLSSFDVNVTDPECAARCYPVHSSGTDGRRSLIGRRAPSPREVSSESDRAVPASSSLSESNQQVCAAFAIRRARVSELSVLESEKTRSQAGSVLGQCTTHAAADSPQRISAVMTPNDRRMNRR